MKNEEKICTKRKHRTEEEKQYLTKRLNVIEGQVRGLKQMIEDDRYCDDILTQISAVSKSLKSLGNTMLRNHLATCIVKDIQDNKLEAIDNIADLFEILNK